MQEVLMWLASVALAAAPPISPSDPPDDTSAILLSAVVGFGAGHYYAGQPRTGDPHAAIQGSSLVAIGVGSFLLASGGARDAEQAQLGASMLTAGLTAFAVDRAVDMITAPRSVRRTRSTLR